jgi:hypothetical protein
MKEMDLPINKETVEILNNNLHEVVDDTLNQLSLFSMELIRISSKLGQLEAPVHDKSTFNKLLEGIELFHEALASAKVSLNFRPSENPVSLQILETDLISILNDLKTSIEMHDWAYSKTLLTEHLPDNLERWIKDGIPFIQNTYSA